MQASNNSINIKGIIIVVLLLTVLVLIVEFFDKSWFESLLESERLKNYLVIYGAGGAIVSIILKMQSSQIKFDFSFFCDAIISILTYVAVISSSFTLFKAACFQFIGKANYFTNIQGIDLGVIAIVSFALLVKFLVDATKNIKEIIQMKSTAEVSPVPDKT
ncbi:hypothetical protein [Acinetobacter sp. YH12052]|uniref:hypothetical protein n=1 Tax=Acinetobacter sp. YH12052 TaxID=2601055 RepID=UPI0015D45524|nr:hypothetical protein [Acinetobacter sp. YH12052]